MTRRYPAYRDSGVEWLGEVPAGWEVKRLRRVARLKTDKAITSVNPIALENIESWSGRIVPTDTEFQGEGVAFDRGDILFGKLRPYLAKVAVAEAQGEAVGDFHVISPTAEIDSHFLQRHLLAPAVISVIDGSTYGSKMPRASWDFMADLQLAVPPLPEQTAIAAFLDRETAKIDALVAEQRRLIDLLKEKRQAVISHAVTRGLNPAAKLKPSGVDWLGDVPEGWEVVPLKYLVQFASGGTPSKDNRAYWDGDIPWASARDLKAEVLNDTGLHITESALAAGAASLEPAGSVLVLVRGMTLAKAFPVCIAGVPMAINQDLKAISAGEQISSQYLAWLLRGLADESLSRIDEAGHGTKALRMEAWVSMEVTVPPLIEQEEIATFLERRTSDLDRLTEAAEAAITLLQERRAALISSAVTGKIDVRDLVPQETEAA